MYLENPQGQVIGENDDYQSSTQSRHEQVLESTGKYQVWPTVFLKVGQQGSYQLTLTCNAPSAPDLVVETPQVSDSQVRPGQSVTVSTNASNTGSDTSQATSVEFVLSRSPTLSDSDRVLGSSDLSTLDKDQSSQEILSVALNVTPGTYYVGSCVNADTSELNTSNNCAVSGPVTVEQSNEPIPITPGLNDAWYNDATNGQGFFINVFPDSNQMFLSWFTFDTQRPPADVTAQLGDPGHRWLTASGTFERGVATLDVFLTTGGVFDAANPPAVTNPVPYGSMIVSFSDCIHGEVEFDLPDIGESGTIPIERLAKDNVADCEDQVGAVSSQAVAALSAVAHTEAAAGSRSKTQAEGTGSSFNYNPSLNDAWYNPATDGQGFFFNVFPDLGHVFLSWFTFDVTRPPANTPFNLGEPGHRWLTAQGPFVGDTAQLKVYNTSGGVFNSGRLDSGDNEEVGTITAIFEDCNSGLVRYDIDSVGQGEVPIERIVRDTIPACEQKSKGDESVQAVQPQNKELMANLCGEHVDWTFDWPDEDGASSYIFQLRREDTLATTSWVSAVVKTSTYEYHKGKKIPAGHLTGWTWRYKPMFTGLSKKDGSWSEDFTFDVAALESGYPCPD
ncbi:hypothetical protein DRQ25_17860 [Candidatus Fermentibacteria bacterium]|nr:MAG: hypothetical protein DRQ25_17860 [Candidatus Fermentibacteria bacterium]